jgi:hypothetical protein
MHVHKRDILISCYGYIGVVATDGVIRQTEKSSSQSLYERDQVLQLEPNWRGTCMTSKYLLHLSENATHSTLCPPTPTEVTAKMLVLSLSGCPI